VNDRRTLTGQGGPVDAVVDVPGSKSIANRALVAAALADGDSELIGLPDGDDTVAMLAALGRLGITFERGDTGRDGVTMIGGCNGRIEPTTDPADIPVLIDAGLAGTTSRFVTAVAAMATVPVTIDGAAPLRARPMADLHAALVDLGATVSYGEAAGHLPVTVTGPLTGRDREHGPLRLRGDVSSQFITALMLIGPLLADGLVIELTTPLVSMPYVKLTAAVMADFGIDGVTVADRAVTVPPGHYLARSYVIEPDASSASYPLAVAALRGGRVTVAGLTTGSRQGDIAIVELLGAMGCRVDAGADSVTVQRDPDTALRGLGPVDLAEVSDLVPTVAVLAVAADSPTTIAGVGFIRAKESDRLADLAAELAATGAAIVTTEDGLHIEPAPGRLHGAVLGTHHDHRLAMAFAVLGSTVEGIVVDGATVVTKSWPGFWSAYDELVASSPATPAGSPSR